MEKNNLCKVELYRFWHSKSIFIGMIIGCIGMFILASANSDAFMTDGVTSGNVNSVMKFANIMLILLIAVTVSYYLGREFKCKTIHHEIMAGYKFYKICLTKTLTCGMFISIILLLCILLFFATEYGTFQEYSVKRIFFLFILLCHICTSTVMYTMLSGNGALGGCFAFVRFTLLEVLFICLMMLGLSSEIVNKFKCLFVMSQWSVVINTGSDIPAHFMVGIIITTVVEYVILLLIAQWKAKIVDF